MTSSRTVRSVLSIRMYLSEAIEQAQHVRKAAGILAIRYSSLASRKSFGVALLFASSRIA